MNYSYIIIDDNHESSLETKAVADGFSNLLFLGMADTYNDGLNLILEQHPDLVFLEIDPKKKKSNLSLHLINELYRFLKVVPKIIITTSKKDLAFDAIQYQVTDYMLKPVARIDLTKLVLKLDKATGTQVVERITDSKKTALPTNIVSEEYKEVVNEVNRPMVLCVKSYGDHRYIDSRDITYLQADNNSTDIHLINGEMITAFKTLKNFESLLSYPFVRIHNSYIVNSHSIARIHTGNSVCYIRNTTIKLPFSKSYKSNVDFIIGQIASGNYLEI
ncbi:DNA-binding response regulator [Flavobacterium faecale]|uniref:DNA-binding response regulator n=1 Tax=Flavobacterium faecale TaxID=1355330 RepID=A0A2S1LBC7_9FLAO|nr:LytTR family transcriptional regulator DNA-binding domain-containing protein [Flavobacterium faecale]AWG21032.1 DNA-binding response regulator [Flavobacterium faecale]